MYSSDAKAHEPLNPTAPTKANEGTPLVSSSSTTTSDSSTLAGDFKYRLQVFLSLVALVGIAVLKTQITAVLFSYGEFPTAYSLLSCVVTCLLLVPCFLLPLCIKQIPQTWGYPRLSDRKMVINLALIVVFTALDLAFTNISLSLISAALQQCIASTNPFWTILIESLLYRRLQHWLIYLVISVTVVGAVLSALASFDEIDAWGLAAACIAVLCSSTKYVFTHKSFKEFKDQMGALALLFWVDLLIIPIYLIWSGADGELVDMFTQLTQNPEQWGAFTGTAALGGVRALTQYVVLIFVSATSMSTANVFTQVLNMIITQSNPNSPKAVPTTPVLLTGIVLTILFSLSYGFLKTFKNALPWVDERLPCMPCKTPAAEEKPTKAAEEIIATAVPEKV